MTARSDMKTPQEGEMKSGMVRMFMHFGETLMKVVGSYPTLHTVLLEEVQNGIDAMATEIRININKIARTVAVRDNGNGVTSDEFNAALGQICESRKTRDKLGRFGIGVVSPLGKCERFTFTSKSASDQGPYITWEFETNKIRAQKNEPDIPVRIRTDLAFNTPIRSGTSVKWRTEILMEKISTDQLISKIDINKLSEDILDRFGIPMRKHKVVVTIQYTDDNGKTEIRPVTAKDFEGKPLPVWEYHDKDSDTQTAVRLYIARKTVKGRQGKVLVGEKDNPYRLPFTQFARTIAHVVNPEVIAAINSGVFEGEIITQATLHVSRKEFEQNEALLGLCYAIEKWHSDVGSKYYREVGRAKQDERYQELGLRSLRVLEGLLSDQKFAGLRGVLSTFRKGTVGAGHSEVVGYKVQAQQGQNALSTRGPKEKSQQGENPGEKTQPARSSEINHTPFSALGPLGKPRTVVRSNSLGIQFAHVHMENYPNKIYELDTVNGILYFNIGCILWSQVEENDRHLMKFQEYIALQALTLQTIPEDLRETIEVGYEELIRPFVYTLIHGDRLAGRQPGKKPAPKK